MNTKIDIKSMTELELENFIKQIQEKPFRAKQLFQWIHQKNIFDYDHMANLSKDLRNKLKEKAPLSSIKIIDKYISKMDGTIKYLFELQDHNIIESVLMRYKHGNTVCISSQVGCRMGCSFCASTVDGLVRNLTAGEMLDQIYMIQQDIGERISNVVIMGSGEPLDNYEHVLNFIKILNSPMGIQIGQRHITLSTCGLVDKIYDLAKEKLQITLAISLHAPNNEIRKQTMPVARKYSMEDLLEACRNYSAKTNRRITFEYALIKGINDQKKHALELSKKLVGLLCHVNLIPVNEIAEREYEKASQDSITDFARILQSAGIETTTRRELGSDINAACGQLRKRYLEENKSNQGS